MKRLVLLLISFLSIQLFSQNIDISILRSLNSPEAAPSDNFFKLVSNTNNYIVVGIPIGLGVAGLLNHDKQMSRNATLIIAANVINYGVSYIFEHAVNRNRPFITYTDITAKSVTKDSSFPSGHTSSAFATATSLSLSYPKWYVVAPSYLWAGTVGYSRMHLGVHYPSDVLGGAVIGAGSALITHKLNKWLNNRCEKKHAAN